MEYMIIFGSIYLLELVFFGWPVFVLARRVQTEVSPWWMLVPIFGPPLVLAQIGHVSSFWAAALSIGIFIFPVGITLWRFACEELGISKRWAWLCFPFVLVPLGSWAIVWRSGVADRRKALHAI